MKPETFIVVTSSDCNKQYRICFNPNLLNGHIRIETWVHGYEDARERQRFITTEAAWLYVGQKLQMNS